MAFSFRKFFVVAGKRELMTKKELETIAEANTKNPTMMFITYDTLLEKLK